MLTSLPKKKICLNPNRYNFWIEEVERKGQVNEPEVEYAEIRMTGGMGISVEEPENRMEENVDVDVELSIQWGTPIKWKVHDTWFVEDT